MKAKKSKKKKDIIDKYLDDLFKAWVKLEIKEHDFLKAKRQKL